MTDMRKSKYTEEQIIGFIKQAEAGLAVQAPPPEGRQFGARRVSADLH
jgi:hypothetical protein